MKAFMLASAVVLASGCATSHTQFPARQSKVALPAADRMATDIVREHHGVVTSKVNMCVAADGDVDKVSLVSSSGMHDYDQAVLAAVSTWEYRPGTAACKQLDVSYRTP